MDLKSWSGDTRPVAVEGLRETECEGHSLALLAVSTGTHVRWSLLSSTKGPGRLGMGSMFLWLAVSAPVGTEVGGLAWYSP